MLTEVGLISAINEKKCIGKDGKLLYHLSDDLKRFKELTTGHMIIMGRKTFESLPNSQPLPNRKNVVLTRNLDYYVEGITTFSSVEDALLAALSDNNIEKVFIIGGAEIYKAAFQYVDTIYITEVHDDTDGDAYFPDVDMSEWSLRQKSEMMTDEKTGIQFMFKVYKHIETID